MAFGYAGNYFGMKGVYDVATKVVLENNNGVEIDTKEANFDLIWDSDTSRWKVTLSDEVVFDVKKDDEIAQVMVSSVGTDLVPSDIGQDGADERARGNLGTGSLPTETADRDGTYTLESLEMYLD